MSAEHTTPAVSMENIVALAKRRGFIFQSSEIYGGFNGFFDYGPLGSELKKNIRDCWWDDMVRRRDDIVGLESSIIMHPKVWEASGHVAGFTDPLVDCKVSKQRYRADQLFFAQARVTNPEFGPGVIDALVAKGRMRKAEGEALKAGQVPQSVMIGFVSALESERMEDELNQRAEELKKKFQVRGTLEPVAFKVRDIT